MMLKKLLLLVAIAVAAQSQAAVVATQTYYFNGTCSDCTLLGHPIATLVLADYTEGTEIGYDNFVSFDYVGSNLVYPITVLPSDVYEIAGMIGPDLNTPADFRIDYIDGLRFESMSSGDWFICSPGPNGFYSGTCDYLHNNDFGTGGWDTTPGTIPIPAAAWLFGSALLGLMGVARRKKI